MSVCCCFFTPTRLSCLDVMLFLLIIYLVLLIDDAIQINMGMFSLILRREENCNNYCKREKKTFRMRSSNDINLQLMPRIEALVQHHVIAAPIPEQS